jgi:2-(1,2-epoxy-1,2-dihydrophenyl)acetyl-CoA isomerase
MGLMDDTSLVAEVQKLCEHFASAPTQGLALIKRALNASATNTLNTQLDLERDLQGIAREIPDCIKGARAFMERRKPNFTGQKGTA